MVLAPTHRDGQRLRKRYGKLRSHLFTFLDHPELPADNNGCERELRPTATYRKVTGGFRSTWAPTCSQACAPSSAPPRAAAWAPTRLSNKPYVGRPLPTRVEHIPNSGRRRPKPEPTCDVPVRRVICSALQRATWRRPCLRSLNSHGCWSSPSRLWTPPEQPPSPASSKTSRPGPWQAWRAGSPRSCVHTAPPVGGKAAPRLTRLASWMPGWPKPARAGFGHRDVRRRAGGGRHSGARRPDRALEQRPSRGKGQPAEATEAAKLRPRRLRPAASPRSDGGMIHGKCGRTIEPGQPYFNKGLDP